MRPIPNVYSVAGPPRRSASPQTALIFLQIRRSRRDGNVIMSPIHISRRLSHMEHKPRTKTPSKKAIIRAVASSTAIETGQSVAQLKRILRSKKSKLRSITLAD